VNHPCKYHPATEALWFCRHDGLFLCQQCVDGREDNLVEARCLLCNQDVEATGQSGGGPLWQQLERCLRLPFTPVLLPVLLVWGLVAALIPPVPELLALTLLGGVPAFGFGQAIMAARTHPRRGRAVVAVPGWDALSSGQGWKGALLQAAPALLVMLMAGAVMWFFSVPAGLVMGALLLLLVPALWLAIQVQGAEPGSYAAAPAYLVSVPRDYAVAAGLASLGGLLVVAVLLVAVDVMPSPLVQGLGGVLAAVWWLSLAALCGEMLGRHGRLWGINTGSARVTTPLAARRQNVQLCAGRYDKVLLSTAKVVKTKKATVADWQRLDRLLQVLGREDERQANAEPYLDALVSAENWSAARQLIAEQQQRQPQWLPGDPGLRLVLARGLYDVDPKLVVNLLKEMHERHPEFSELGNAYLLLARALAEKFGLGGKAEQYLRFVESHCRDARLRQQVAEYRAAWGA